MSPTLYTAKNNGGDDNGVSTTMVIATTMANNGIRFGDIRSTFPSSCYRAISELYKSSRQRRARSRLFYQHCGGMYGVLHGWNVSGVMGQRYSVCEEGQNERPLTVYAFRFIYLWFPILFIFVFPFIWYFLLFWLVSSNFIDQESSYTCTWQSQHMFYFYTHDLTFKYVRLIILLCFLGF